MDFNYTHIDLFCMKEISKIVQVQIFDIYCLDLSWKKTVNCISGIQPLKESQLHIFIITVLRLLWKKNSDLIWCVLIGLRLVANFCDQIYEEWGTELCFMCLATCHMYQEIPESSAYLHFFKVHLPLETTCLQTYRLFSN